MVRLFRRILNALCPGRAEDDLARETRAHLALLEATFERRGLTADEARVEARRAFGGVEHMKDRHRDARSFIWLDDARRDLRHAMRLLQRNPIFTLTAALSLAIGVGANVTIFTIANALLLQAPAGVADPGRLVDVFHTDEGRPLSEPVTDYRHYLELRRRATAFEGLYAYQLELQPMSLAGDVGAELVHGNVVTSNYFGVLGLRAAAGRLFGSNDRDEPGASPVVVLSHRFWTRRFNEDPTIVGRTLRLNRQPFVIVGVAPEGFQGMSVALPDLWIPTSMTAVATSRPPTAGDPALQLRVMIGGRLKPGISRGQAAAEVDTIGRTLAREDPDRYGGVGWQTVAASPVPGSLRPLIAGFLALLMAIVSLVLVIACANVAGVLLARATARRREIAIRLAIGAGRARLVRQLLTETLMLFTLGAVAGVWLARGLTTLLVSSLPSFPVPVGVSLPLDGRVIAFAAALSLIAATLSGLAPALHASKADVVTALKDEAQGPSDRLRLRHVFVVAQVALTLVLIVAAGLLGRALRNGSVVDAGFDPRGVEAASIDLSLAGYTNATGPAFLRALVDRIGALPGVEEATAALDVPGPGARGTMLGGLTVPGVSPAAGERFFQPIWNLVEPGYFATLRLPMVAGRDFNAADRATSEAVAIVSETAARRLWPGQDAVGKQMSLQATSGGSLQPARQLLVVGVARDVTSAGSGVRDRRGPVRVEGGSPLLMYMPVQQHYVPGLTLITRATGGQRVAGALRAAVASMDPNLPIISVQRLDEPAGPIQVQLRIAASVSGSLGVVGLLLAAIGIYGVTSYAVICRTREIGVRVAMGAQRSDIIGMVMRHGMGLVGLGAAIGLMLAAATSRLLTRLLFGVPPLDPTTFAGAAALFAVIGLAACYIPARRATRVDPCVALRCE